VLYDITNRSSFEGTDFWLARVKQQISRIVITFLVGNKLDLLSDREVSEAEGKTFAIKNGLEFMECSAKVNENHSIEHIFQKIAIKLMIDRAQRNDELAPRFSQSRLSFKKTTDRKNEIKADCCS